MLWKGEDQKPFCQVPDSYAWSSAIQLIYFPLLKQATALGAFIIVPASCLQSINCCHLLQIVLHLPTHGTLYGDRNNGSSLTGLKCNAWNKFRLTTNYLHYFYSRKYIFLSRSNTFVYNFFCFALSYEKLQKMLPLPSSLLFVVLPKRKTQYGKLRRNFYEI